MPIMRHWLQMRIGTGQLAAVKQIVSAAGFGSFADWLRAKLKADAAAFGVDWPDENQSANGADRLTESARKRAKQAD